MHAQSASLTSEGAETDSAALPASPQQPFHGSRGDAPGPGGCWAVKADGQPCRAARTRISDYCSAHSGLGIAADPASYSPKGIAASAESRRAKAELRLALGITRPNSPRSVLKGLVGMNATRLAGRAVNAALDPEQEPLKAADLALRLIDAADPKDHLAVSVSGSIDPSTASLDELVLLCEQQGISLDRSLDGSVEPSPVSPAA